MMRKAHQSQEAATSQQLGTADFKLLVYKNCGEVLLRKAGSYKGERTPGWVLSFLVLALLCIIGLPWVCYGVLYLRSKRETSRWWVVQKAFYEGTGHVGDREGVCSKQRCMTCEGRQRSLVSGEGSDI